jgi:hypothetical protein
MCVDHRGADITVAEEFLKSADIVAVFEQVGGERMAERVTHCRFSDARLKPSFFERSLQDRFDDKPFKEFKVVQRGSSPEKTRNRSR